jgi:hypothetical protein
MWPFIKYTNTPFISIIGIEVFRIHSKLLSG